MAMDLLRSCYSIPMRLVSDSDETTLVNWYFPPDDAQIFPGPHSFGSHVWDSEVEQYLGVGEVGGLASQKWVKSTNNRGYKGQCFTGKPEWFVEGIPSMYAYIWPECPECATYVIGGGLVLGGAGRRLFPVVEIGHGGLDLGGQGQQRPFIGQPGNGGLRWGGLGQQRPFIGQPGNGGLLLGGHSVQHGEGGQAGSGGLRWGGQGAQRPESTQIGAGGVLIGGNGYQLPILTQIGAGGMLLGGLGTQHASFGQAGSGGMLLGGLGTQHASFGQAGSGGLHLGGQGFQLAALEQLGSGGLRLGGAGVQVREVFQLGSGGLRFGGAGVQRAVFLQFGSGGLRVGGVGQQFTGLYQLGSGGLRLGGAGVQGASGMLVYDVGNVILTGTLSLTSTYQTVGGTSISLGPYGVNTKVQVFANFDFDPSGASGTNWIAVGYITFNMVQSGNPAIITGGGTPPRTSLMAVAEFALTAGNTLSLSLTAANLAGSFGVCYGVNSGYNYTVIG